MMISHADVGYAQKGEGITEIWAPCRWAQMSPMTHL